MMTVTALEVVRNTTFICQKLSTRSAKLLKKKIYSGRTTRRLGQTLKIRVLIWDFYKFKLVFFLPIAFNCTHDCLSTFIFMQFHPCQNSIAKPKVYNLFQLDPWFFIYENWPLINKQTFNLLNFTPGLINLDPYINVPSLVWPLALDLFNQVSNCSPNFNIYSIKPLIWPN